MFSTARSPASDVDATRRALSLHSALGTVFRAVVMSEPGGATWGPPVVTGLSPTEGTPGTQITIRGEFLGQDPSDLIMLFICGTDCLHTAKWKSQSKIVARVGQANRGLGEVKIATKSGGRGSSNVKFRVFIAQVGPLEESAVWADETRTVPGRETIRNVAATVEDKDALGLKMGKKADANWLHNEFPDSSSNLRMESFNPQLYLLEHHMDTALQDLRIGLKNMEIEKENEAKKSEEMHKANLYSLINCVDSLAALHSELENANRAGEFAVVKQIASQITEARKEAESVFKDVLGRKDRADATRNALSVLTRFKFIFFLNKAIDDNMAKGEYATILNDYTRAKSLFKDTEVTLFKEVMTGLDAKMEKFKEELKHRLIDTPTTFEEQSKLIKYLKILEPDSDPAWECITAYHCWLEDVLWRLQETHHKKAVADAKMAQSGRFMILETNERQVFVSEMVSVLLAKLQAFWKLASTFNTNESGGGSQKQEDVNQMLTNTINVSSWLLLNALVPKALPDEVMKRYETQFVQWPPLTPELMRSVLSHSLKTLRGLISSLLDCQFTSQHVQPLIELCMTVRLKAVSDIVDKGVAAISNLGRKENWQEEYIGKGTSRTALPDFFENEVCDCISSVRDVLATNGYPGEADLFSRERFKQTLIELFVHIVISIRHCFDRLLNLRPEPKRPEDLDLSEQKKMNGGGEEETRPQVTTKKLLISICNLEFILGSSLKNISRRLTENGVKYADMIFERSRSKLQTYRQTLVRCYITIKCSAFQSLISSARYDYLPDDDVSDFAKEVMMCCVLEQAELERYAPQLTHECLQASVQAAFQMLIEHLMHYPPSDHDSTTQCVIDISALEQSLSPFLSLETRTLLNSYRAELVGQLDQKKLQRCLTNMRNAMRMAIESLECGLKDDLNVSNI